MAPKPLEPLAVKLMKGVIIAEVIGVFCAYGLFKKMDSSRDFRKTMNSRFPRILEVYYKSNEWAGTYGVRETDRAAWTAKRD